MGRHKGFSSCRGNVVMVFLLLCHLAATTGCDFTNYCLGTKTILHVVK